jgi:hypothetical protein
MQTDWMQRKVNLIEIIIFELYFYAFGILLEKAKSVLIGCKTGISVFFMIFIYFVKFFFDLIIIIS